MTDVLGTRYMVFVGSCLLKDKKLGQMWHEVIPNEDHTQWTVDPCERIFQGLVKPVMVGAIYEFDLYEGNRVGQNGRYQGMLPSADKRAEWAMAERVFQARRKLQQQEKEDRRETGVRLMCEGLRRLYQKSPAPQRAQLLAAIVYEITRRSSD